MLETITVMLPPEIIVKPPLLGSRRVTRIKRPTTCLAALRLFDLLRGGWRDIQAVRGLTQSPRYQHHGEHHRDRNDEDKFLDQAQAFDSSVPKPGARPLNPSSLAPAHSACGVL